MTEGRALAENDWFQPIAPNAALANPKFRGSGERLQGPALQNLVYPEAIVWFPPF